MKKLFLFTFCSLFFHQTVFTQTVWPGDVNNNGIVNEVDLLYLGFAFGETGTPRTEIDTNWTAQTIIENWEGEFSNGVNFAYADCNGDGIVDVLDADVVEKNYLETHGTLIPDDIVEGVLGEDPRIVFPQQDLIIPQGSSSIDVDIGLGTAEIPVDSILGLAFTIRVNPELFVGNQTQFKLDKDSWLNPDDEFSISKNLKKNPRENGLFTFVYTRTDKMPVANFGSIGTISFVVESDVVDLLVNNNDSLEVVIDSVIITDDNLEPLPVLGNSINLQVEELIDSTTTSTYHPILDNIKVYPNPTSGWLLVKTGNIQLEYFELFNMLGQAVLSQKGEPENFQSLDLGSLPTGTYLLRMVTEHGIKLEHIQKF